jgi:hypothetical protein
MKAYFMRERFQKGHLFIRNKKWVFQYWDGGHRKKSTLGPVVKMTKTEAQKAAAATLAPINARSVSASPMCLLADFIVRVYMAFFCRKWKRSTALTNEDRIKHHIISEFGLKRKSRRSLGRSSKHFSTARARVVSRSVSSIICVGT